MSCRRCSSSARRSPDLVEQVGELTRLARLLVVHVDDRADLLEREPEPLAAQDEVQPRPVPAGGRPASCRGARGRSGRRSS